MCGLDFKLNLPKPKSQVLCACGGAANRVFKNIGIDIENENVSTAIRTMLFSKNPSGKDKTAI